MSSSFDQLLDALSQPSPVLPKVDLNFLSDLDVGELGRLAQEHIELNFDRVDRMALSDPDGQVRRIAIENLWESEDPALVPARVRAPAAEPDRAVRAPAAAALGAFVSLGEVERLPTESLVEVEAALLSAVQDV